MLIAALLWLLSSAPGERDTPLAPRNDEITAAFEAGNLGRLMRLWSAHSPARNAGRSLLSQILVDRVTTRLTAQEDEARGIITLELRDRAGTLLGRYEMQFRREEGEWRAWSLAPVEAPGPVAAARVLLHRGDAHFDAGELDLAQEAYQRAAAIADTTDHTPTRAAAQRFLGNIAYMRGDGETATRHFENSMTLARAAGDRREIGKALDRLAAVDNMKGDYGRAEARWGEALQIFRETGDHSYAARSLNALGNMRGIQGDFAAARKHFEDSLRIYESLGDALGMSTVLNNLGTDLRNQGAYREAVALFRRALELSRSIDDQEGVAYAFGNLGNSLTIQGEYVQALHAFQQALDLHQHLGNTDALVSTYLGLGELYRTLGNLEQAHVQFEKGMTLAEKIGWKDTLAVALHNLGQVWLQRGDPKRALELFARGMAIDTELGNRAGVAVDLHNIGRAHLRAGDRAAARHALERSYAVAEEIGGRETMAITLAERADLADDLDEALELAERAVAMTIELGLTERLWETHAVRARVHRRAGRLAEARRDAERAIAYVEELRRGVPGEELAQQAFEMYVRAYHLLIGIQVEQGDVPAALENAERAKARVLLDVLRHGLPDLHAALTPEEREREAALAAQVVQASNETRQKARLEYDAFLTRVYVAHPQLRRERGEMTPARADEIEALLAAGKADAFLEFVVTEESTFLFTITRGGDLRVHTITVPRKELQAEVLRFRNLLASRDVTYAAAARALYDRLLAPAAEQLRGRAAICIVPDGPLWELPFQALQPARAEFLLDRHTLYSVPSLTVLRDVTQKRAAAPAREARLLAFGNPRGETPLPHAETEVRRIAAMYGSGRSRVHLGAGAREEVVKAEARDYDVLHFATHGVLDDQNALYSHLVFAPEKSKSEDGMLEAREIMRLGLRARLAVLSACETARGRVGTGEGLIGMSWALFVAGVPTSVVSQWKVDSSSTAELMVELHRALRAADGTSVPEALRRAALKTRAKPEYRHPFYWAPFVSVGSP